MNSKAKQQFELQITRPTEVRIYKAEYESMGAALEEWCPFARAARQSPMRVHQGSLRLVGAIAALGTPPLSC